jgi:hypothetical protein
MRSLLALTIFICMFFLSSENSAQITASRGFYFSKMNISKSTDRYDASDVFARNNEFNRLTISGIRNTKHQVVASADFGFFWTYYGHSIAYHYWLKPNAFIGVIHQTMPFYIRDDQMNEYGYFKFRQIGIATGLSKSTPKFEFDISPQILFGKSPESTTFDELKYSGTNKRSLRQETFDVNGFFTTKLEGSIAWQFAHFKRAAFKLKYTGALEKDWFVFENHSAFYEWTKDNAIISDKYQLKQTFTQWQNNLALEIRFNK